MTVRTTSKTVTFSRSFTVPGIDGVQVAGTYNVDTDEELLENLSFPAYRRIATWIWLPVPSAGVGSTQIALVDPLALETALAEDGAVARTAVDAVPAQAAT